MGRDHDAPTDEDRPIEAGYVMAPARIGRRSRRWRSVVAVAASLMIGLVVAKPWGVPAPASVAEIALASAPAESTTPATAPIPASAAVIPSTPPSTSRTSAPPLAETWPVTLLGGSTFAGPDTVDLSATTALASHIGAWGVAAFGDGPRFVRDEPWVDWFAIAPRTSSEAADRIATWPGTGECSGTPIVPDLPQLVAVTTPVGVPASATVEGWWSDGGRTASLDGSIRALSGSARRGVTYLERIDGTSWPAGRYEFHVSSGDDIVALVVCLDQTG